MRKSLLLGLALIIGLAVVARPRDAEACGGPIISDEAAVAILVVAGAYAGTTVGMAAYDITADNPSRRYGVIEAAVHTPLALAFGAGLVSELSNEYGDRDAQLWLGAFTAIHASLAVHGMYTAGKSRPKRALDSAPPAPVHGPPGMVNLGGVRANVTLTPVSDGRSLGGGLGLVGSF